MKHEEKLNKMTKYVENTLRDFGARQAAKEFLSLYENYRELAAIATQGECEDTWTHKELMRYLDN